MLLRQLVVISLAVCATAVTSDEDAVANSNLNADQRAYDLLSIIRALQYLNSQIQEEALKRLSMPGSALGAGRSPMVVSVDDATYAGNDDPAFVRGQRAVRNPLRFGKRESFRQPLRFGKRAGDQALSTSEQLQQGKRLSAVRNPLRFGKRADLRQPLRFGKRLFSEPLD
uniref:Uncharacterized protein n=1 Tax=Plectus sambesii TaxID=2011161 RepID=A0A914UZJ0_9BILA